MKKKILIANGVNLDLLGRREPQVYGSQGLSDLETLIRQRLPDLVKAAAVSFDPELEFFQSNSEAEFLNQLGLGWAGAVINPGAWTHTSIALADRISGLELPVVEVHLSNVYKREPFRHKSFVSPVAEGVVCGLGFDSYLAALLALLPRL